MTPQPESARGGASAGSPPRLACLKAALETSSLDTSRLLAPLAHRQMQNSRLPRRSLSSFAAHHTPHNEPAPRPRSCGTSDSPATAREMRHPMAVVQPNADLRTRARRPRAHATCAGARLLLARDPRHSGGALRAAQRRANSRPSGAHAHDRRARARFEGRQARELGGGGGLDGARRSGGGAA